MRTTACASFRRSGLSRRSFVQAGALAAFGPSLPRLLAAEKSGQGPRKIRSCILLFMFGGPSHLDTFDMKPDAPAEIRGEFGTIATRTPGLRICEHLPRLAQLTDKYALIRSNQQTVSSHNPAAYYQLCGHEPANKKVTANATSNDYPAYGSVISRFAPTTEKVPNFVSMPTMIADGPFRTPGEFAGYLGKLHDPLWILRDPNRSDFRVDELQLPDGLDDDRLAFRRNLRDRLRNRQDPNVAWRTDDEAVAGLGSYYERAYDLLTSQAARRALRIHEEPEAVRERYGRTTFGQSTLLARRLVEAGVRFVTVYYSPGIGGWDTHKSNFPTLKDSRLPSVDVTLSALLEDLEQRGLWDETLVIWMGEFGRTPKINADAGRDHWPQCYTTLLAGAGIPGGLLYGASDSTGAYPTDKPVTPDDFAATLFTKFGIDPHQTANDQFNRPVELAYGQPIPELL